MNQVYDHAIEELKRQNIRLSTRRQKVLEYLCHNLVHPTVDRIYVDIKKELPNLSKTTIYNILDTFVDAGLVRIVNIEDNEVRYDIITEPHGHFKCVECGAISDFEIDIDSLALTGLSGCKITDQDVYFKGICPECLLNINNKD
ncbi:MAG: Fur family transcriptional regulator [Syntrophomonadaceae bacterium]|nr:Fur family transcriptional regulator [Syntrophomonadaceae bacterium]